MNVQSASVKRLFVMTRKAELTVDVVLQIESLYGYRLVTLRSTVQVRLLTYNRPTVKISNLGLVPSVL